MRVGLFADNTVGLPVAALCDRLNALCKRVSFVPGEAPFRLTTASIASPSNDETLSAAIIDETAEFDLTCLATHVPYDNNHFFDSAGSRTIISFSGWNALTGLPITNGFVYFIASILVHQIDLGSSHDENTGCINDFWWDKTGVDVGMRAAFICGECLGEMRPDGGNGAFVADIQAVLDAVSQASRTNRDILDMAAPPPTEEHDGFDVFICHNSDDKPAVRTFNDALKKAGIRTWLDEEQLQPGQAWQPELERQIERVRSACVLVGKSGFGPWQTNETRAFLDVFDGDGRPVIPVLLPDADAVPVLPIFLRQRTWTDLRENHEANLDRLVSFLRTGSSPVISFAELHD